MQAEPTRSFASGQTAPRTEPENYLKNAEMATEDDYGMIDGILNNGRKGDPVASVQKECSKLKKSVLKQLREKTHPEPHKQTHRKSIGKERTV